MFLCNVSVPSIIIAHEFYDALPVHQFQVSLIDFLGSLCPKNKGCRLQLISTYVIHYLHISDILDPFCKMLNAISFPEL